MSRSYRRAQWVVVPVVVLALGATARAQAPSEKDLAAAKEAFERAEAYKKLQQFDNAIEQYREAYELSKNPALIFNVAQAFRLKGEDAGERDARIEAFEQAVEAYERYLGLEPSGAAAEVSKKMSAALRDRLAEERAAKEAEAERRAQEEARRKLEAESAAETEDDARLSETDGPSRQDQPAEDETSTDLTRTAEPGSAGRGLRITGIGTAVAGMVGIGLGVKFGLDAQSISDELSETDQWGPDYQSRYEDGEAANRNMIIAYAAGGVAVLSGAALYYLGHRQGQEARFSASLIPSEDGGMVAFSGRF